MRIPTLLLLLVTALQAAPRLSDVVVTDVSDRAVRLIAHSSEPAEPSVLIYQNAALTVPATGAQAQAFPGLDSFRTNLATDSGLMIVDLSNLAPDTTYYLRLKVRSLADNSESTAPTVVVKTALAVTPFNRQNNRRALANPVLKFHTINRRGDGPPLLGVLLATVQGARTPVSTIVTSETTSYLEMQNLIDHTVGTTMPLTEDRPLTLTLYRGDQEIEVENFFTSGHPNLATVISPKLTPGNLTEPLVAASGRSAQIYLEFPATVGGIYQLEYSDSLTPTSWTTVDSAQQATSTRLFWMDHPGAGAAIPPSVTPKRFYRIKRIVP